jgi:hypothetical protein
MAGEIVRKDSFLETPLADIITMADAVAKSGLFACRSKEQAMTLMLLAQAERMHPIQAMRQFHIIEGRPTMRADAILARFRSMGGKVAWSERTSIKCSARFQAPDSESEEVTWTIDDAKTAGLAGKDNWRKYPRQMLMARVISEGVRATMPEVICGLYTPEEVQDFDDLTDTSDPRRGRGEPLDKANGQTKVVASTVIERKDEQAAPPAEDSQLGEDEQFYEAYDTAVTDRNSSWDAGRALLKFIIAKRAEGELGKLSTQQRQLLLNSIATGQMDKTLGEYQHQILGNDAPRIASESRPAAAANSTGPADQPVKSGDVLNGDTVGMFDASCPRCGRRYGWSGRMADNPGCPDCSKKSTKPLQSAAAPADDAPKQERTVGDSVVRTPEPTAATEVDLSTWEKFTEAAEAISESQKILPTTCASAIRSAVRVLGKSGKEGSITLAKRQEWYEAMKAGAFNWATGKIDQVTMATA